MNSRIYDKTPWINLRFPHKADPYILVTEDLLLYIDVQWIPIEVPVMFAFRPERLVDIMLVHSAHDFIGAGIDLS